MTSRFVGLPCCLTIIFDNAFLPTPAKYECQAPKFGYHVTSLCQGLRCSAGSGGEDPENQVGSRLMLKQILNEHPKVSTADKSIKHAKQCKMLGVEIDQHLTWKSNFKNFCSSTFKTIG